MSITGQISNLDPKTADPLDPARKGAADEMTFLTHSDKKVGRSFKKEAAAGADDGADESDTAGEEGLEDVCDEVVQALQEQLAGPSGTIEKMFASVDDKIEPFEEAQAQLKDLLDLRIFFVPQGEPVKIDIGEKDQPEVTLPAVRQTLIINVQMTRYVLLISKDLTIHEFLEHASMSITLEIESIAVGNGFDISFIELHRSVLQIVSRAVATHHADAKLV